MNRTKPSNNNHVYARLQSCIDCFRINWIKVATLSVDRTCWRFMLGSGWSWQAVPQNACQSWKWAESKLVGPTQRLCRWREHVCLGMGGGGGLRGLARKQVWKLVNISILSNILSFSYSSYSELWIFLTLTILFRPSAVTKAPPVAIM